MRLEIVQDLAPTLGDRTLGQIDNMKAVVLIGATDVRTQRSSFGKGLRPFTVIHENLTPRRGKKNRRGICTRDVAPRVGCTPSTVIEVADEVGQAPVEET